MSSNRRRRPAKGGAAKASPPAKTTGGGAKTSGGGGKGSGGGAKTSARRRPSGADFWGRPGGEPSAGRIRPTPDPGAVPRSLGDPPLGPNPAAAAGHLAVIYEEAVRAATALAAANGLLDDEDEEPV
jgi:hypothetical protein